MRISALSEEYVYVPLRLSSGVLNPDAVEIALPAVGIEPSVWYPATMVGDSARILVGPPGGATVLTAGEYTVWVRVTEPPETPIKHAGRLVVF